MINVDDVIHYTVDSSSAEIVTVSEGDEWAPSLSSESLCRGFGGISFTTAFSTFSTDHYLLHRTLFIDK